MGVGVFLTLIIFQHLNGLLSLTTLNVGLNSLGSIWETYNRFRVFNFLTEHSEFTQTVAHVWEKIALLFHSKCALYLFQLKLKGLKIM